MLFISCTHSVIGDLINTDIAVHAPHIGVTNEFTLGLTMKSNSLQYKYKE